MIRGYRTALATGAVALALWTLAPGTVRAGVHVWTGTTPRAKGIEALAVDPLTPTRMWAATFGGGVARTTDGGATWTLYRTGLINTFVRSLAVQPRHPDSLYCGTNDGVFLSTDGGVTWNKSVSTNVAVRAIVIHPIRTGVVYAATSGAGIMKSINGGKNWSAVNAGLQNTTVRDIAYDPAKPETLLAGTGTLGGIHRSVNGGLTWEQNADTTAKNGAIEQIAFDPLDPNRIYAATLQRGVIKSGDRGVTWVSVNRGLTNFRTRAIALVDTLRYVGTDGSGVFYTSINDTLWHPVTTGLTNLVVDALLTRAAAINSCWAGTDGGGVFFTGNRGSSWSQMDGGLLNTYGFSLAVRPATGKVYDGCGFGDQTWRSSNSGGSWTRASYLFTHDSVHGIVPDPLDPQRVYLSAYGSGVYRSSDDGATWLNPDSVNVVPTLGSSFVRDLVAYPGQSGHLYAGGGNGVWETFDGGDSWSPRAGGLPASFSVRSLTLVPGTPPTLYAGSDSSGVWKSADGGANWTSATAGIPVPFIHTLLADAANPLRVFAGTDSGLYRTQDGGASWVPIRGGLPYGLNAGLRALVQASLYPQVLFAGTAGSGVFESSDGGSSWTPVFGQAGLTNLNVRSLAVDPVRTILYAGTDNGVFSVSDYPAAVGVDPGPAPLAPAFGVSPNPSSGRPVRLAFSLAVAGSVELGVFDASGARVRAFVRGTFAPGEHALLWDGRDDNGRRVSPGLYFARLRAGGTERTLRLSLTGR